MLNEAEWALTDHPLINLITVKTLRQGVVSQVTPLINIPKVRQLSKMIDGITSYIPKIMQLSKMIDLCTKWTNLRSFRPISYTLDVKQTSVEKKTYCYVRHKLCTTY